MKNIAIIGGSAGDESKGNIAHRFSKHYDWVIRTSGANNCGHTVYRDGVKYVHNLIPSFDWRSNRPKAFLGLGMAIDLPHLHKEVLSLFEVDKNIPKRVYVDPDAFIILPEHIEEDKAKNAHIGTTNRGVGPAFAAKVARCSMRVRDVMETPSHIHHDFFIKMKNMGVNFQGILELKPHMKNESLIFEGAQAVLLDINHGTYPYVTSSETTIATIYSNGFHWADPHVYGIAKCYSTRVGEGPFVTELFGEEAEKLRKMGNEYGATTGRPRRVGWLDLPAIKYSIEKGGIDSLIITKLDILSGSEFIKICDVYDKPVYSGRDFFTAKPGYMEVKGWNDPSNPDETRPFISTVEDVTKVKVDYITYGTSDDDMMKL